MEAREWHFEAGDDIFSHTMNASDEENHWDPPRGDGLTWFGRDDLPGFEESDFLGLIL